jgi:ornithine carbamoyltransferase
VLDLSRDETLEVLQRALKLKHDWNADHKISKRLRGCTLAAIYEKPSLRTRVTFEAGMTQLGGHSIYLGPEDIFMDRREPVADIARNLSRWVQIITVRTFAHSIVLEMAEHSRVPVINALTDLEHPCQALADFLTLKEQLGSLEGKKIAWIGDGNNVLHSLLLMSGLLGVNIDAATPEGYEPQQSIIEQAQQLAAKSGATISLGYLPQQAVQGADAIFTDVWTSMGQENEGSTRRSIFAPFQVTPELMAASGNPKTIFLHCLPAHRGEEVVDEVIDGPQSVVFDEAENRLHAQKALVLWLLGR